MKSFVWANWPAPPQVRACTSTRFGGISVAPYDSFNLAMQQCHFKPQDLHGGNSATPYDLFNLSVRQCLSDFKPQALHACSLSFNHPVSGKLQRHRSRLPEDFSLLLSCLRKRSRNGEDA